MSRRFGTEQDGDGERSDHSYGDDSNVKNDCDDHVHERGRGDERRNDHGNEQGGLGEGLEGEAENKESQGSECESNECAGLESAGLESEGLEGEGEDRELFEVEAALDVAVVLRTLELLVGFGPASHAMFARLEL